MTFSRILSAAILTVAFTATSHAAEVGMREISVAAPQRGHDLQVFVWYPAEAGGEAIVLGDNRAFKGVPAFK
ncbi:dienelactone hydrolase, partial [Mesorhizobium sp. M2A.F.Ca.ET.046.02.1.1]